MAPALSLRLSEVSCPGALCDALHQAASHLPTKTLPSDPSELRVRQAPATVTVQADNSSSGTNLSGGAIAGIVIGSIAGFLLLLWIFRSCGNLGAPPQERENWYHDVEPMRTRSRSPYDRHHHHHHRRHSDSHRHHSRSRPEVAAVTPVVVREDRRRSREVGGSRSPRRPEGAYVYDSGRGRSGRYYASS